MTRRDGLLVGVAWLAVVIASLPFLGDPAQPDEGGYLQIAAQWDVDARHAYGAYWVDRPPLLLLLFRIGALVGGLTGARLVALAAIGIALLAAAVAGRALGSARGAFAAVVVTSALCSSATLGAFEVDGEILGIPFVLVSIAAVLSARSATHVRTSVLLGLAAGASATAAVLVKQNLADAFVFAVVLLGHDIVCRRSRRSSVVLAAGAFSTSVMLAGLTAWAHWLGPGVDEMAYALIGFRIDAGVAIGNGSGQATGHRAAVLLSMVVVSGLGAWIGVALVGTARGLRRRVAGGMSLAVGATAVFGMLAVAAGGSYWDHYLIQLIPIAAIGAARCARATDLRPWLALTCVVAGVGTAVTYVVSESSSTTVETTAVLSYLRGHRVPGDTAVVTYSHANVLWETGMSSPYRYLWSLPTRVRDPRLTLLTRVVTGADAPTWIVEWDSFDSWGLDPDGALAQVVRRRYRPVDRAHGRTIWLRHGVARP